MLQVIGVYLILSLVLLFGAAALERRAIVARRLGPNGRAFLLSLVLSMAASLGVTGIIAFSEGWVWMLHVLGASILYHGVMGIFLVHGLQEVSARVAGHAVH